jgi:hypothetical protein
MNQNVLFMSISVLIVVILFILFIKNHENYEESATHWADSGTICDCSTPERVKGGGLIMSDDGIDIETFIKKLNLDEKKPNVVPLYCSTMYENYNQYFSERWESLGLCEQENLKKINQL